MVPTDSIKYRRYCYFSFLAVLFFTMGSQIRALNTPVEAKPNILIISMDTTRQDHCSVYGYHRNTTPVLTRFAEEGCSFTRAYAPCATTSPSHVSLFTSLYPITHRVIKNGLVFSKTYPTMAEILQKAGYQTAAYVSSFVLNAKFGLSRGFSVYNDSLENSEGDDRISMWEGITVIGNFSQRGERTARKAIRWLETEREPSHPFFLFVHFFDPHTPYMPPKQYLETFGPADQSPQSLQNCIDRYDEEILYTDNAIGSLLCKLKNLSLYDNTIVVVLGDHGEGLMDHNHMYHGIHIYEEAVKVPLLFRWPGGIKSNIQYPSPVSLLDIMPTILDLIGLNQTQWVHQGINLAPILRGNPSTDDDRPIFLHRRYFQENVISDFRVKGEMFGMRIGRLKYIVGEDEEREELYDLSKDPHEQTNLLPEARSMAEHLIQKIAEYKKLYGPSNGDTSDEEVAQGDLDALKALGYVE